MFCSCFSKNRLFFFFIMFLDFQVISSSIWTEGNEQVTLTLLWAKPCFIPSWTPVSTEQEQVFIHIALWSKSGGYTHKTEWNQRRDKWRVKQRQKINVSEDTGATKETTKEKLKRRSEVRGGKSKSRVLRRELDQGGVRPEKRPPTHRTGLFFGPRGQRGAAWVLLSLWEERALPHSLETARTSHLSQPNQAIYTEQQNRHFLWDWAFSSNKRPTL